MTHHPINQETIQTTNHPTVALRFAQRKEEDATSNVLALTNKKKK
jgi:hypothetical protein